MTKDLRIIKTEESLRNALLLLIKTKSIEHITISELCRNAKINRGTFYHHYRDVHEVFDHYFEDIVEDLKRAYREPYVKTNYNINKLNPDMIEIFSHVKKYQPFYQIIFDENMPMKYYYMVFDAIRKFVGESIPPVYKDSKNEEINYQMSYHSNAIIGIIVEWHHYNYETPIEVLNEKLIQFVQQSTTFDLKTQLSQLKK